MLCSWLRSKSSCAVPYLRSSTVDMYANVLVLVWICEAEEVKGVSSHVIVVQGTVNRAVNRIRSCSVPPRLTVLRLTHLSSLCLIK